MESKTKNRKTRAQIEAMAARAFGGLALAPGEDAVQELKEGWFNASYAVRLADGQEVILKIAPPRGAEVLQYEKDIMTTEVATMRLAGTDPHIPVPHIFAYDAAHDLCDSDYFFMEKLRGDNLGHVRPSLSAEVQAHIDRQIGAIVRHINGFTGTYFGYDGNNALRADTWREAFIKIMESVLQDGQRKEADYGMPVSDIRAAMLKHAPALDEVSTPCLVHWDAWDLNFFVKDGQVSGIIDFERALWADPLMEAQFRALDFGGSLESLNGYGKTTFTPVEEARCRLYTLHLALVMKTECYYRNYDTDEVSNMAQAMLGGVMQWLREN